MKCKISFIGIGHMNKAILNGLYKNQIIKPNEIGLYTRNKETLAYYQNLGFTVFNNSVTLAKNSEIVLIGVKPQNIDEVIEEIKFFDKTFVSIAAGISIDYLNKFFKNVIRVMPNIPIKLQLGATAISHNENVNKKDLGFIVQLFESLGIVKIIPDS